MQLNKIILALLTLALPNYSRTSDSKSDLTGMSFDAKTVRLWNAGAAKKDIVVTQPLLHALKNDSIYAGLTGAIAGTIAAFPAFIRNNKNTSNAIKTIYCTVVASVSACFLYARYHCYKQNYSPDARTRQAITALDNLNKLPVSTQKNDSQVDAQNTKTIYTVCGESGRIWATLDQLNDKSPLIKELQNQALENQTFADMIIGRTLDLRHVPDKTKGMQGTSTTYGKTIEAYHDNYNPSTGKRYKETAMKHHAYDRVD